MDVDFTSVAKLLGNPARSAMVAAMLDGRAITAGELARVARVELTGAEVAEALEALAQICPRTPVSSLRASAEASAIGFARTCYDHIAGVLGVAILDGLLAQKWLVVSDDNFEAGPAGYEGFAACRRSATAAAQVRSTLPGLDGSPAPFGRIARRRLLHRSTAGALGGTKATTPGAAAHSGRRQPATCGSRHRHRSSHLPD